MAPLSTALTTKVESGSPYQLDKAQTLKASAALLKHIKSETKQKQTKSGKKNLLAANSDDEAEDEVLNGEASPVWLTLTTKRHIIDKKRLKPSKVTIPHPLHASLNSTICLITVNPQRQYKDIIASDTFPAALRSRITRIIDLKKLKAKYKSFESRRQLRDSHDMFLADDRIVTELPLILGKSFYKQTAKRPIPVNFAPPRAARNKTALTVSHGRSDSSSKKSEESKNAPATAPQIAHEITRTLSQVLIHLSPSTCTAVRIGLTSFTPEQVAENVQAVVAELVDKFVPKGWRGVRSVHIKGPETMALPIWLAEELWVDENDILEAKPLADAEASPKLDDGAEQKLIKAAREPLEHALKDTAAEKSAKKDKKRKAEPLDQTLKESTAAEKAAKKAKRRNVEPVEQAPVEQALNATTTTATETITKKIKKRKAELEVPLVPATEAGNPKKARKDGKKKDKAEPLKAGKKGLARG